MRQLITFLFLCVLGSMLYAQGFEVGHTSMTFIDDNRDTREIPVEIYYPATTAGEDVPVAGSNHPVLSFGHGFIQSYVDNIYIADSLVPYGYIVAFLNTETGFSPSHEDFGLDFAFAIDAIKNEGQTAGSLFEGTVGSTAGVMGYSMGGGASFLAASYSSSIDCMVTLAPAETSPSAVEAGASITIPALVLAGSDDCIASPADHQIPLYQGLGSNCKTYIEITGGSHCKFANNELCDIAELLCSGTIDYADQHNTMFRYIIPFLAHYLKGDANAITTFNGHLVSDSEITYQENCGVTSIEELEEKYSVKVYPNPVQDMFTVSIGEGIGEYMDWELLDISGKLLQTDKVWVTKGNSTLTISMEGYSKGIYMLRLRAGNVEGTYSIVKE